MLKGLFLSACVFILLFLLYNELAPTVHNVVVQVNDTMSRTTAIDYQTAAHWFKVIGLSALVLLVVRDLLIVFGAKRRQKPPPSLDEELGPRMREERERRRREREREMISTVNPEAHRWE